MNGVNLIFCCKYIKYFFWRVTTFWTYSIKPLIINILSTVKISQIFRSWIFNIIKELFQSCMPLSDRKVFMLKLKYDVEIIIITFKYMHLFIYILFVRSFIESHYYMSKKSWPILYSSYYIKWVKTSWTCSI